MECPLCLSCWNRSGFVPRIVSCGHSFCEQCCVLLFQVSAIKCPNCEFIMEFDLERNFDETNKKFAQRCVRQLPINETLLVISEQKLERKPSENARQKKVSFTEGMLCQEHGLAIHSYTLKPYSLVCSKCAEELSEYGLEIEPFPELVDNIRKNIQQSLHLLSENSLILERALTGSQFKDTNEVWNRFDEHFHRFKTDLQSVHHQAKRKLKSQTDNYESNLQTILTELRENLEDIEFLYSKVNLYSGFSDEQLVGRLADINKLVEEVHKENIEVEIPQKKFTLNLEEDCPEKAQLLMNSSVEFKFLASNPVTWKCDNCYETTEDCELLCESCKSFRPINTYGNILVNPMNATSNEIYELEKRRELELQMIGELDEQGAHINTWYIINAEWVTDWKNFIFNKTSRNSKMMSPNPKLGILPPGPISNHLLFEDPLTTTELKKRLKPVAHYRGVNEGVWELYLRLYGGGPAIVRKKLDIYSKECQESYSV